MNDSIAQSIENPRVIHQLPASLEYLNQCSNSDSNKPLQDKRFDRLTHPFARAAPSLRLSKFVPDKFVRLWSPTIEISNQLSQPLFNLFVLLSLFIFSTLRIQQQGAEGPHGRLYGFLLCR